MAKEQKVGVLEWRGLLAEEGRLWRMAVVVCILILCASLTFTQLGFAELALPNMDSVYVVLLLVPLAFAALLLGAWYGALVGLIAGAVLYAHARFMPHDVYEMAFVNVNTTVMLFTLIGFLLGVFFALALRGEAPPLRRFIRIVLICIVFSWIYTIGFGLNASLYTIIHMAESVNAANVPADDVDAAAVEAFTRLGIRYGDVSLQGWIGAVLMAVACIAGDVVVRRVPEWRARMSIRALFNMSLIVVVANVFLIVSAVTFVLVSANEREEAFDSLRGNVEYLCAQVDNNTAKMESLNKFLEAVGVDFEDVSQDDYEYYAQATSALGLMDNYAVDVDGVVFEASGTFIIMSNLPNVGWNDNPGLDEEIDRVVNDSVESGLVRPFVYDGTIVNLENENGDHQEPGRAELAYMYGKTTKGGFTLGALKPASLVYRDRPSVMLSTTLSTLLLLLAVSGSVAYLLNRVVARRIDETNGVLARITGGDLEARVEVRDTTEFKSLSDGINTTVDAMKGLIAEAETRMDAELATAKAIQESALPRTFPPYPDIMRFDIYASMQPAKQVGGDFYDFFLVGDDNGEKSGKLAFIVADVSGKGVPAALFMMEAKSQLRSYVASGMELGEAVENANRQLCDGNDAGMFVTAWVGVLDYGTGHVEYVNAGHNPPLLWSFDGAADGEGAGQWRWLTQRSGLPLGLFDGVPYRALSIDCLPGDQFLLYSDGVTEAMSVEEELYGEDRLMALANECVGQHARSIVSAVRASVAAHAAGAEQSDDITILSLEAGVPPEITATFVVPADISQLDRVNDFIHTELDRRQCPQRVQNQLDIAVEELFVNVCHYAYPDAPIGEPGYVRVGYTYASDPPSVKVDLVDDGVPYDPLAKPDAVTPDDIMDVPVGGLGILMAKRSVDEMRYERVGNSNVVTIVKKW